MDKGCPVLLQSACTEALILLLLGGVLSEKGQENFAQIVARKPKTVHAVLAGRQ